MRRFRNGLASRLALLLTLALAPLGGIVVFSEYQGWMAQNRANEDALIARALETASGPRALLESAMISAMRLSSDVVERLDDPEACSTYLANYIEHSGFYSFAGFIDIEGRITCSSAHAFLDLAQTGDFLYALANPEASFSFQSEGVVSRRAVVVANRPIFNGDDLLGFLSISIARDRFDTIAPPSVMDSSLKITYLVNARGDTLTQYDASDGTHLLPTPEQLQRLIERPQRSIRAASRGGDERVFTSAEVIPGALYALTSWAPDHAYPQEALPYARFAFPVLMWLASIAVVMLAVHYLVTGHLRQINRELRRFALGHRDGFRRLPAGAAPELREIDATFNKMAMLIRRDETLQEEALREKTVLLKEVHHRVKNNLQMIASILNLQMRRLSDPDARAILQGVQGRVRALATIHRTFYEQKQVSDSYATQFLETILTETLKLAQSECGALQVETDFEPVDVGPDKIIPTGLLFSEALSNALKYARPPAEGEPARLIVTCCNHDGFAELTVRNTVDGAAEAPRIGGLGQELMTAFALQIGAELHSGPVEDARGPAWEVVLRLPLTEPDPAVEERAGRRL